MSDSRKTTGLTSPLFFASKPSRGKKRPPREQQAGKAGAARGLFLTIEPPQGKKRLLRQQADKAGATRRILSSLQEAWRGARALAAAIMLAGVLPAGAAGATAIPHDMHLPQMKLRVGGHTVQAEIAATEASQQQGLMYRKSLRPDHGMLFVFEQAGPFCFWMKNTLVPLSIAFITSDGTIANIADMQPQTENPHCPVRPVLYALEMQQGWFGRHHVQAGQKVIGLPRP